MDQQTELLGPDSRVNMIEVSCKKGTAGASIVVIIRSNFHESLRLALNNHILETKQVQVQGITSLTAIVPDMNMNSSNMFLRICFTEENLITKTQFVSNFFYENKRGPFSTDYESCYYPIKCEEKHQPVQTKHDSTALYNIASLHTSAVQNYQTQLTILGDLESVVHNWTTEEWSSSRRLVYFQSQKDGNGITCNFQTTAVDPSYIVSCIFWLERNDYFITSVDLISLAEFLLDTTLSVEEKNRIRRNLEGFRPVVVSKFKLESVGFFRKIMSYSDPKPRNIEKGVKVFSWRSLPLALKKIVAKSTCQYKTGCRTRSGSLSALARLQLKDKIKNETALKDLFS